MPECNVLHGVCVIQLKRPMTEGKVREDQGKRTGGADFTSIQTGVFHAGHDGSLCCSGYPTMLLLMCEVTYLLVSFQAQVSHRKAGIHRSQSCGGSYGTGLSFPCQPWLVRIREFALNHTATWLAKTSLMEGSCGIKDNQCLYQSAVDSTGKRIGIGIGPKVWESAQNSPFKTLQWVEMTLETFLRKEPRSLRYSCSRVAKVALSNFILFKDLKRL